MQDDCVAFFGNFVKLILRRWHFDYPELRAKLVSVVPGWCCRYPPVNVCALNATFYLQKKTKTTTTASVLCKNFRANNFRLFETYQLAQWHAPIDAYRPI